MAIQDVNQTIKWFESKYHEHNLDFTWSITPFTHPNNFETYLKNYGFKEVGKRPHMGLLHSKVDKKQFEHELEETDLEIRKIKIENLDEYMNSLSIGFGFSENKQIKNGYNKLIKDFLKMLPSNSPSGPFLGYVNDRPVCTSLGFISDNVMGIYYVATIPEFRKRGYGRLMTTDLIIRGANAKTKGSILQASEMGKTVYEKIGFATRYFQKLFKLENKIKRR